jgi:hypothetical protein
VFGVLVLVFFEFGEQESYVWETQKPHVWRVYVFVSSSWLTMLELLSNNDDEEVRRR